MDLKEMTRAVRQMLSITQSELAQLIGTNQTEVSFIERGFYPKDETKIKKIEQLYREENKKR